MAHELEELLKKLVLEAERGRRMAYLALGFALVVGVMALDTVTPYELNFAFLYPLPILLVTIAAGQSAGLALSVVCALFVVFSEIYGGKEYSRTVYMIFDMAAYFIIYATFTKLTGLLCTTLRRELLYSHEDELTGLANRRRVDEFAQEELERCRHGVLPFSLILVDCRDFREVNATFGRAVGDKILQLLARTLKAEARPADLVGRLDGDKFAFLLHDQSPELTSKAAHHLEAALTAATRAAKLQLSFCIGAVCCTGLAAEYEQILAEANAAMHKAYDLGIGVVFQALEC